MSGYTDCACRDCFEIAIGEPGEAFCHACEEAGCEGDGECDAEGAYSCDEEFEEPESADCPACGGPGVPLGALGNLEHFRCRNCGIDFNRCLSPFCVTGTFREGGA
jgi:hypothetical protein